MLSNEIIRECMEDISEIMQVRMCLCDNEGNVLTGSLDVNEDIKECIETFLESSEDSQQMKGYYFFKIYDGDEVAYLVITKEIDLDGQKPDEQKSEEQIVDDSNKMFHRDNAYNAGSLAVGQLGRLIEVYKEKFSRNQFIQNLLLDNLVGADIFNQSRLLGIEAAVPRTVFVVETEHEQDEVVLEMIRELYGKSNYDFVTAVDDRNIILVKELREDAFERGLESDNKKAAETIANMLVDMINVETMSKVRVGYSNPATDIKEVSKAYREAKMAVEVGKIFYSDKTIVAYNMLGIGRLIYQLPTELCDMFLEEVFGGVVPEKFDEEMLATINKFFELNLNLSETARQMYIHRNTLAYRLERIEKMTGLDIRSFEDAMTFKLALMVADYRRMKEGAFHEA